MEYYNHGLEQRVYDRTNGRVAEIDSMNEKINEILRMTEENA